MTHTQGSHLPEVSKLMGRKQWLLPQGKPRLGECGGRLGAAKSLGDL